MHFSERIHDLYYKLPDFHRFGIIGKILDKVLFRITKGGLENSIQEYFKQTSSEYRLDNSEKSSPQVICSLTSFPARIDTVWIAIECLFRQTHKPDRIILWLSLVQFPDRKLPESIEIQIEKGLEVYFVEDDIKAHKKYFYALQRFPNDFIVTYDDDLYYDSNNLANLIDLKAKYPCYIVTNRAHKITLISKAKQPKPYKNWIHNFARNEASNKIFATGGYGTLYHKSLLPAETFETKDIKKLSYRADDVWLKCMEWLSNSKVATNTYYGKDPITIGSSQNEKLVSSNVLEGGNDTQLKNVMNHFRISQID